MPRLVLGREDFEDEYGWYVLVPSHRLITKIQSRTMGTKSCRQDTKKNRLYHQSNCPAFILLSLSNTFR